MHTLFVREHNWWAAQIARDNPRLTDEQIYQQARAIVDRRDPGRSPTTSSCPRCSGPARSTRYRGYNPTVNPEHRQRVLDRRVPPAQPDQRRRRVLRQRRPGRPRRSRACARRSSTRTCSARPASTHPQVPASTHAQEIDNQIVDSLRNFLFGQPGQGGLDLASLNIQRGRDHGLADYNTRPRGLRPAARHELRRDHLRSRSRSRRSKTLYGSVDNIDLWVGGLAEDHVAGALGRRN